MRALFALILLSLSCVGHAADDPKLAAARRLVDLLQIDEVYEEGAKTCRDRGDGAAAAQRVYEANRAAYGGLSPRSAYWPEVVGLYGRYLADSCEASRAQSAKEIYVRVFARRLSQDQLEQAVAAMSTPDGQALQAASREAGKMLSIAQYADQEQAVALAAKRYRDSIQELVKRHEADPRQNVQGLK